MIASQLDPKVKPAGRQASGDPIPTLVRQGGGEPRHSLAITKAHRLHVRRVGPIFYEAVSDSNNLLIEAHGESHLANDFLPLGRRINPADTQPGGQRFGQRTHGNDVSVVGQGCQ